MEVGEQQFSSRWTDSQKGRVGSLSHGSLVAPVTERSPPTSWHNTEFYTEHVKGKMGRWGGGGMLYMHQSFSFWSSKAIPGIFEQPQLD